MEISEVLGVALLGGFGVILGVMFVVWSIKKARRSSQRLEELKDGVLDA